MATKKVVAKKKVVKKTPAKKVAPKKRAYRRKAKPVDDVVIDTKPEPSFGYAEVAPPDDSDILQRVEVIDMRLLNTKSRFNVLALLDNEGYLTTTVDSFIDNFDNLTVALNSDVLHLNHNNKLVSLGSWESAAESSAVSAPFVQSHVNIGFPKPAPVYPEEMEIGQARYIRVG